MWHPKSQFPDHLKEANPDEKISYFNSGFVLKHHMIQKVHDFLRADFFYSKEQQIALVAGPTGVGKTCLAQAIFRERYGDTDAEVFHSKVPIIYFEADVHSSGGFSWKDFYARMLCAMGEPEDIRIYGVPVSEGEFGARKYSTRNRTELDLRHDLEKRIADYAVEYVLLDEIQHLFKYGGKCAEKNLDILKNISNKTGCRFICLGTYEIFFSIEKNAQLSRRIMTIDFPGYRLNSNDDYVRFVSAWVGLLAHMPIEMSDKIVAFSKDAYVGSCGCIGILKEWLNRALRRALMENKMLSIEHLISTRLKGSQLKSIAEEIREGIAFFVEPDDLEILDILNIATGQKEQKSLKAPDAKVNKSVKPGVRKPSRDAVV